MNGMLLLSGVIVLFLLAYFGYGAFLKRTFGVDPSHPCPSETKRDGIDYIPTPLCVLFGHHFASIAEFIDGRMICGAGGGGFLQVILKKGVKREQVHQKLKSVFEDNAIDVWDSQFVF